MLLRSLGPAFWITTLVFLVVLGLMASGAQHNTLAALVGVASLLSVSYLGGAMRADLFIFDFRTALLFIDWNVIFLIMGMMIVIAVVEEPGVFSVARAQVLPALRRTPMVAPGPRDSSRRKNTIAFI